MSQSAILPAADAHCRSIMREMQHEACYLVALTLFPISYVLILGAGMFWGLSHGSILGALVFATFLSTWGLLTRNHLAGAWLLVVGCVGTILLTLHWYPSSSVAMLLALPSGLAAIVIGMRGGIITALFSSYVIFVGGGVFSPVGDGLQGVALISIWGTIALVWISLRTARQAIHWSWDSYERATRLLEEAREHRLVLKETEQDLIEANRQLAGLYDRLRAMHDIADEARRAKEEFVANVSHELRTPLNMIIGFSEMITKAPHVYGAKLPSALLADIDAIQRNSLHLSSLVDDVLDLSQVEAGRVAISKEWTSLLTIIDAATSAVSTLFESKGLFLDIEVPPDLPDIYGDGTRIRQVVLNLLSNAVRFTERGGVKINAWQEKDNVVVSVKDTGPGISSEDQDKIFEPFQQLDGSIRRRYGGSGLGLSICKRFVEMHGGKMWLESTVGMGTTFYFSLPLDTVMPGVYASAEAAGWLRGIDPYSRYQERTRRTRASPPKNPSRFVLLEAGSTIQKFFRRYMDGAEIVSARTIDEALEQLNHMPAQALIANIPPFRQSPALMNQLAHLPYDTPAAVCWIPSEDEAAQHFGVLKYLVKPVMRETLLATLESMGEDVNTVLLVDDEPETLQLFARMISSSQRRYRVLRAVDGQEALSVLRQRRPDAILLDLAMPGIDGFEVLQRKMQDPTISGIPVVVISARDPMGESAISNMLTVTRGDGLSMRDLVSCIQSLSTILLPPSQPGNQGRTGRSPGR